MADFGEPLGVVPLWDLVPADVRELARVLGDEAMARRIVKLQAQFPVASLPELICYDWLRRQDAQFVFQGEYGGGRTLHGGQVPDFVISWGGRGLVWRVQGDYWHTLPGTREKDLGQKMQMMGQYVNGLRVAAIVDVWESDVYRRREHTLRMAMAGIGIRD